MTVAGFILVPLLAGYAFSTSWAGSRYRVARASGYSLYFSTALYGGALLVMACLVHMYMVANNAGFLGYLERGLVFFDYKSGYSPFELRSIAILIITLGLGLFGGHLLNFIPFHNKLFFRVAIHNEDFERLVVRAIKRSRPMMVSLDSGKIYIGYVIRTIDPVDDRKELRMLPVLSAFRSPETGKMTLNTNYSGVLIKIWDNRLSFFSKKKGQNFEDLSHLEPGDFEIVIPVSKIVSSSLYDHHAYDIFNREDQEYSYKFRIGEIKRGA